ncbi:hypothetical protein MKZ38_007710 [Zalerion maritima]|uniref:Sulfate transporter protein n=1 Tax=Zalerion maritima TaxID=339359 RepID=A0AAD5RIC6_9PEZI|nr:hypothetical protein MKZ38_007710 [Zalerion maritima]
MAVFVDLGDDDVEPTPHGLSNWPRNDPTKGVNATAESSTRKHYRPKPEPSEGEVNPNKAIPAAQALACYPVAAAIASCIDLNTLDNLSRTCRSIHNSLISYRTILMSKALRCTYEDVPVDPEDTLRYRARAGNWFYMEDMGRMAPEGLYKSGSCARDMVSACRRCGTVVCRNCAIKPPAPIVLKGRHRRLCNPCAKAPITSLTKPSLPPDTHKESPMMKDAICTCLDGVWLCQPCGRSIRSADQEYLSIWRWRNQYGEVLGGLGTGIGEGDRGVTCARGAECQNSRFHEHEVDCEAEDMKWEFDQQGYGPSSVSSGRATDPLFHDDGDEAGHSATSDASSSRSRESSPPLGPGYARHEIEGIGGVVKKKLLKIVRVGACVPEWEDEKIRGSAMSREVEGRARSWCGWCWRVIPSTTDIEQGGKGKVKAQS